VITLTYSGFLDKAGNTASCTTTVNRPPRSRELKERFYSRLNHLLVLLCKLRINAGRKRIWRVFRQRKSGPTPLGLRCILLATYTSRPTGIRKDVSSGQFEIGLPPRTSPAVFSMPTIVARWFCFCKAGDHFLLRCGVCSVDENNDAAVKGLRPEPLGDEYH